jgi:hypothetical protein
MSIRFLPLNCDTTDLSLAFVSLYCLEFGRPRRSGL